MAFEKACVLATEAETALLIFCFSSPLAETGEDTGKDTGEDT